MHALKTIQSIAICLFLAATSVFSSAASAQAAATVNALTGTATATTTGAPARTLRMGDTVANGDLVATGPNSSLVLLFTDGQIAALTANSRMSIIYTYNRAEPAKSNILFSLAQGGLRAITGLIGKAKPDQVAYRSGNATIGIRGTDVEMGAGGGELYVIVNTGQALYSQDSPKVAQYLASGNVFAMAALVDLPASLQESPLHLAQGSIRNNVLNAGQGVFQNNMGQTQFNSRANIFRFTQNNPSLNETLQQQQSPQFQSIVTATFSNSNNVNPQQQSPNSAPPSSGNIGSPSSSGSGGGGSSNFCTSVSPILVPAGCVQGG